MPGSLPKRAIVFAWACQRNLATNNTASTADFRVRQPPGRVARRTSSLGDRAGGPGESPMLRSISRIAVGSWIAASRRRSAPQFGHTITSAQNTRRKSSAHV